MKNLPFLARTACASLLVFTTANAAPNTTPLAAASQIPPHASFNPPPFVMFQKVLTTRPENQFDGSSLMRSNEHSVANELHNANTPLHFTTGLYGTTGYGALLGKFRTSEFYGTLAGFYTYAGDYKDGGGYKIGERTDNAFKKTNNAFGYKRVSTQAMLGWTPNAENDLRATFVYDNLLDDKQPHSLGMDYLRTTRYFGRADYRLGQADDSNTLRAWAQFIDISRRADNNSLRKGGNGATIRIDRQFVNAGSKYDIDFAEDYHGQTSLTYASDDKNVGFFNPMGVRLAWIAPRAVVRELQVAQTFSWQFATAHKLNLGAEYAYNWSKAREADGAVPNVNNAAGGGATITPREYFYGIYGKWMPDKNIEHGVSVATRYEFAPTSRHNLAVDLQSIEVIGDVDQRYGAASNLNIAGNPFLKKSRHNRARLEFSLGSESFGGYLKPQVVVSDEENSADAGASDDFGLRVSGSFLADMANDFFVNAPRDGNYDKTIEGNIVFRNADVQFYIARLGLEANLWRGLGVRLNGWYNYGEDTTNKQPLYQVRPLEGQFALDYEGAAGFGKWNVGVSCRAAAKQTRRSKFALDSEKAGFAVADLYATIAWNKTLALKFGVDNVFDKEYSEYISASHVDALTTPSYVNAPGRTFYVTVSGSF